MAKKNKKMVSNITEKVVNLEGLVVGYSLQSEGSWEIRVETTNLREMTVYDACVEALKLTLTEIDDVWSEKRAMERNLRMQDQFIREEEEGKKAEVKTRVTRNYIQFNILPQAITNSIKYVRKITYQIINKYAIKIPLENVEAKEHRKVKYMYVVPKNFVPDLRRDLEELNKFIYDVNYVRGKKTQKIVEGEEGKLSLKDYYASPYFQRLKNLVVAMATLQKLGNYKEFKELMPRMKGKILSAIHNGEDLEPIISELGEKYSWIMSKYREAKEEFENAVPSKIRDIDFTLLRGNLPFREAEEWIKNDPETTEWMRREARKRVKPIINQMVNEVNSTIEQVRKRAKTYIKAGAGVRVGEELELIQKKFDALGIGEISELNALVSALKSGEDIEENTLYNLTDSVGSALDSIVESVGVELGEEAVEMGEGAFTELESVEEEAEEDEENEL